MLDSHRGSCAWGHDDINLERNQFGRKNGEPLELPLGGSVLDDKGLPRHPPTLAERLLEHLKLRLRRSAAAH